MKKFKNEVVLVISDTHFPYHHPDTFDFLRDMQYDYCPDRIVHCGDLVDFYNASRYPKDPDHPDSFNNELKAIRQSVKELASIFPKMSIVMGNHDARLRARTMAAGMPEATVKNFSSVIRSPKGWRFYDDEMTLIVDSNGEKLVFAHHLGANSLLVAQQRGMTVVTGHQHSKGNVVAFNNGQKIYFGCNCPNLISNTGCPFRYTKLSNINPVRGCLVIEAGVPNMKILGR